jgi:hypothetical protein
LLEIGIDVPDAIVDPYQFSIASGSGDEAERLVLSEEMRTVVDVYYDVGVRGRVETGRTAMHVTQKSTNTLLLGILVEMTVPDENGRRRLQINARPTSESTGWPKATKLYVASAPVMLMV